MIALGTPDTVRTSHNGGPVPLGAAGITSPWVWSACAPGWVSQAEKSLPRLADLGYFIAQAWAGPPADPTPKHNER